jgi:hypothetical protein
MKVWIGSALRLSSSASRIRKGARPNHLVFKCNSNRESSPMTFPLAHSLFPERSQGLHAQLILGAHKMAEESLRPLLQPILQMGFVVMAWRIAAKGGSGRKTAISPEPEMPKRRQRLGRSTTTGVSSICAYNSVRTGTPAVSSATRRARSSGHSTLMLPPAAKMPSSAC